VRESGKVPTRAGDRRPGNRYIADRARREGGLCGVCGRVLEAGECVWVLYLPQYSHLVPECAACAGVSASVPQWWRDPSPCARCARPVIRHHDTRAVRQMFCSDRCSSRWQNAQRNHRGWLARRRQCVVCGVDFTPSRKDGLTCKPACRQKAYRQRSASLPVLVN
jgi:hypothetical protein